MSRALDALTGWTLFGALVLALGALTARWLILPHAAESWDRSERRRHEETVASTGVAAGFLLVVAVFLYFVRQLREFRDPYSSWIHEALLLLSTAWGRTWSWAVAGSVLVCATFLLAHRGRAIGWLLAVPVVMAMAAFPGVTGHAAGDGPFRSVALVADAVHILAAGAWIGGLALVLRLALDGRRDRESGGGTILADLVPVFSPVAMVSVGVLVLTGTFAAWLHVPSLRALWTTAYGGLLALKVLLAAVMIVLGAVNVRILTPRLQDAAGDRALRRTATVELVIAQVVLVVTAVLVRTAPMGG